MNRTVACKPECFLEGLDHDYFVQYIFKGKASQSNNYPSFQDAFDVAINFAEEIIQNDQLTDTDKQSIVKSISIIDSIGNDDVTTAELKNILLYMLREN